MASRVGARPTFGNEGVARLFDIRLIPGVVLGSIAIAVGLAIRSGRNRRWARLYRDEANPIVVRHLGLGLIPIGASLLLLSVATILLRAGSPVDLIGLATVEAFLVAAIATSLLIAFPPRALKPDWLIDEERGRQSKPKLQTFDWIVVGGISTGCGLSFIGVLVLVIFR